jgi:hypothetical protein
MSGHTVLLVEAVVAGRRGAGESEHRLPVPLASGPTTLGRLFEAVVRAEIDRFLQRAESDRLVRVLTDDDIVAGLSNGAVRSGGRQTPNDVDIDQAVQTALAAQRDGLVQVVIDDEPLDDLTAAIELRHGTRVMFLRLVPLVGG